MSWDAHYADGSGFRWWPSEELVRWVGNRRLGRVLEVGCGNGANLWFLAEQAESVVGIDTNEAALSAARGYLSRRSVHGVTLSNVDVSNLPYPDRSFDVVVDCMVAQHFRTAEHLALFFGYRRILSPGGTLFLLHLDSLTTGERGEWVDAYDWSGVDLFPDVTMFSLPPPRHLVKMVEAAGFGVIARRGLGREYEDGWRVAHYTVIVAAKR